MNSLRRKVKSIDPDDRTAGVDVHNANVIGVGLSSLWDFGGQISFRVAHAIFFNYSLSVFVLVVDLCHENGAKKTRQEIYEEAEESLTFVKSARRIILMKSGKVTLVTVGNKRTSDCESNDDLTPSRDLKWGIDDAIDAFRGIFESALVAEFDCNRPYSSAMDDFRRRLKDVREKCVQVGIKIDVSYVFSIT